MYTVLSTCVAASVHEGSQVVHTMHVLCEDCRFMQNYVSRFLSFDKGTYRTVKDASLESETTSRLTYRVVCNSIRRGPFSHRQSSVGPNRKYSTQFVRRCINTHDKGAQICVCPWTCSRLDTLTWTIQPLQMETVT